ncbi:MAG TPA: TlpA disulfide reductase family protein [Steroidobacteraceae bacterium]
MSPGRSAAAMLAVAGILAGFGTAGFLLARHQGPEKPTLQPTPPLSTPRGPDGPPAENAGPQPRPIPERPPDFSLPDLAGVTHTLSDWRGRPLAVNFWATWCEPCRREIPLLKALRRENARNRFEIIGIAVDNRDSVAKYVHDMQMDYPILVGERGGLEAAAAFGMEPVLPFTVFVDPEGRIVTLKVGELHRDEATFILARLTDVGAGRMSLQAAREQIDERMRRLAISRAAAGSD